MTAPALDDLETSLIHLEAGLEVLHLLAARLNDTGDPHTASDFHWVAHALKSDLETAQKWFDAAHEANVVAKRTSLRAVL